MTEASSTRGQRAPLRVVLLSLLVLGHFLCSVCHGAADATAEQTRTDATVASADQAGGVPALHGLGADGEPDCAAGDAGSDQRAAAATGLLLLGLGAAIPVAALRPPQRPRLGIARWLPTAVRGRSPLFLTLCIQRV